MSTTLDKIKTGQYCKVIDLDVEHKAIRRRLLDMGITKDAVIHLKKVAPLGDPLEINVRGYSLSIRKEEAKDVFVKQL